VLWSCNWAPVTRFVYTRYGVETFGVPVALSNGAFGDDIGISEMTSTQQKAVMQLFNQRKLKPMQIGWVEEVPWNMIYKDRAVGLKWEL
jgi:hypothetical protein